jgi:hypothetical protein
MITEEQVYIYIVCALKKGLSGEHVNITSKDFAARVSMPVKKFLECE